MKSDPGTSPYGILYREGRRAGCRRAAYLIREAAKSDKYAQQFRDELELIAQGIEEDSAALNAIFEAHDG